MVLFGRPCASEMLVKRSCVGASAGLTTRSRPPPRVPIQTPPVSSTRIAVDRVGAQRVEPLGVALVVVDAARLHVPDVEAAAVGADPHVAGSVARQRGDAAARQVQAVFRAGAQILEAPVRGSKREMPPPKVPTQICLSTSSRLITPDARERGRDRRIVQETSALQRSRIDAVEAAAHGADPDVAVAALEHGHDAVVAE